MKKSFTLVEILISTLIIAIVSLAAYISLTTLSRVEERSGDTITAHNLTLSAYEEIKARSYRDEDFFNNLTSIYPSDSDVWESFDIKGYPDDFFERLIAVEDDASSEFEHIRVSVRWREEGDWRRIDKAFSLARPPDPLPGNIEGTVSEGLADPIQGVLIEIQEAESGLMISVHTDNRGYFTFENEDGNYQLSAGTYSLSATHERYEPVVLMEVVVNPDESTEVDIQMQPLPEELKGTITGRFIDPDGSPVRDLQVRLYSGGSYQRGTSTGNDGTFRFREVPVEDGDGNSLSYTVATNDAYRVGYCGRIPHQGWGKQWHYMGWSSSLDRGGGTILAGNPWWGSTATDRIEVIPDPGITDMGSIVIYPVPTATMSGTVRYQGAGVDRARVSRWWHDWVWLGSVRTNNTGQYTMAVPAAQELFPDDNRYRLRVRGSMGGSPPDGCGYTPEYRRAPSLYVGTSVANFDFDLGTRFCGNVDGHIRDDITLGGLSAATVTVRGRSGSSNALGNYCVPEGGCGAPPRYTVATGRHALEAERNGYYAYTTEGNRWYARIGGGRPVHVEANETTEYNFRMFPRGYGGVEGAVLDSITGNPIEDVEVVFRLYDGGRHRVSTESDGEFSIDPVLESWPPPPDILNNHDGYYNTGERLHRFSIDGGDEYEPYSRGGIEVIRNQTTDVGNIFLIRKGQM